jgi:hypothetical protein
MVPAPVGALLVAAVALALFASGMLDGFAYDDVPIVLNDARIRSFSNLPSMLGSGYWQSADLSLYRPLTTLSFALDWSLAPANAVWFHFTNVLLNAGVGVLVFLLLARLFGSGPALAGALIFVTHPVHVEAVTNIVGRSELLSAAFMLGCCLVWARDERESRGVVLAPLLFALALFSKESAIMLPAALVLVDGATGRLDVRRPLAWLKRDARAVAALGVVAVAYLGVRFAVLGAIAPAQLDPVLEVATGNGDRILTALQAWPIWLGLLFAPISLLADYGPRIIEPAVGLTGMAAAGLMIATGLIAGGFIALARGNGRLALVLLWLPVTILPVSNLLIPIGVLVGERTLYLPSFALAAAVAGIAALPAFNARPAARLGVTAVVGVMLLFAARVLTRIPDWRSTDTIMESLVRDRPDSFRGHWHVARMAREAQDVSRAVAHYDTAVSLWPHRRGLLLEAAAFAAMNGEFGRATGIATLMVRQWPDDLEAYRLIAGVALDANDRERAAEAIRAGLAISPGDEGFRRMSEALDSMVAAAAGTTGP